MSDTKNTNDGNKPGHGHTLSLGRKSVDTGRVRQNISHGRSKTVVVETKRKRIITAPGAKPAIVQPVTKAPAAAKPKPKAPAKPAGRPVDKPKGRLTSSEQSARERALAQALLREKQEAEERLLREQEEQRQAEIKAREKAEREAEEARIKAEEERKKAEEEKSLKQEKVKPAEPVAPPQPPSEKPDAARAQRPATQDAKDKKPRRDNKPAPPRSRKDGQRRRGKLTITNALNSDRERGRSMAALKRRMERQKKQALGIQQPREKRSREVVIPDVITIQELANRMAERAVDVIKLLMKQGAMHQINDIIDTDTAQLIAEEMGHTVKRVSEADVEEGMIGDDDDESDLLPRAPVVTVMGHVDHGKTSILDAMRNANVVSGEAGGITQHIGAYQVKHENGVVSFIDTPGHAAFTSMRARGAQATDIVVLVVAANDGVMPQTVEAINHARAADVPIIVAINKIDLPEADPNRVRTGLLNHEIVVESMGGDTLEIEVSATEGTNLDKLIELILLQAEVLELKANPNRPAEGMVVEAQLDRGRGAVATVLVKRGTLKIGNIIVAGPAWGKVRALIDDHGNHVAEAGPAMPVEVLGLNTAPDAGDMLVVVENEARAREITEYRARKRREARGANTSASSLEQMMSQLKESNRKEVPILLKADVKGSAEAIVQALDKMSNDEVVARVIHHAVGGISESDVELAKASNAVIFGFNVRANKQAMEAAQKAGIEIRYYSIIYDLVDDIKGTMTGLLDPTLRENFLGNAEILEVFNVSKVGKVAGCVVTDGKVQRGAEVRLIRDNVVVHEGKLSTLKRFKDEVKEVVGGQECGMAFENYQDMRKGDVIECFSVEKIARSLEDAADKEKKDK